MVLPLWKSVWWFLRKLGMILPEDPILPLLGIYPEDSPVCNKDTCSTMFIAALFIIAKSCMFLKEQLWVKILEMVGWSHPST